MDMHRSLSPRTLLCVGNDAGIRPLVAKSLCEYELVFAESAFEALRNLNVRAFDAYVSDYWLCDWAGPQLCRAIRDLDPHCPVVFFTAAAADQNRRRALRAGASAYCCHTTEPEALKPTMIRLLAHADSTSLAAKARMEHAVLAEIARCASRIAADAALSEVTDAFVERSARKRAYDTFIAGGGCRAHFERWWPQVFASARASHNALPA